MQLLKPLENRIQLLLKLRLGTLPGLLMIVWPATASGWLERDMTAAFILVIVLMTLLSIGGSVLLKKGLVRVSSGFLFFQLSMDALAFTALLNFTGGPWNPFATLLLFMGAVGALLLRGAWLVYFLFYLLFCLALLHWEPVIPGAMYEHPIPSTVLFPAQAVFLLFCVGLLAWMTHELDERDFALIRAQEDRLRMDRLRAFGVMATGFSHEFSTPLATLRLRLNRLARKDFLKNDPDLLESLTAAQKCENSLKSLLQRQLSPDSEEMEYLDLEKSLKRTVKGWEAASDAIVTLTIRSHRFIHAPFYAFTRMILDLLDNAHRANQEAGSKSLKIAVTEWDDKNISIAILDEGPGFPSIILQNIGMPFFTTHSTGSGLGIYHAWTFCEAMGGQLLLENATTGKGAAVRIVLPTSNPQGTPQPEET